MSEPLLHVECQPIHYIQNFETASWFNLRRNEHGWDRIAVEGHVPNAQHRPGDTNNKDKGNSMLVYA